MALLTSIGAGKAIAAPAAERPVVDLRTWPMPDTDISKLPDNAQNRLIKLG